MKIRMKLLSDAIFGNGVSVPGEEDISILCDDEGFPYYKGGTFKGIFREEMENLYAWQGKDIAGIQEYLGSEGDDTDSTHKLVFSDLTLSDAVKDAVRGEKVSPDTVKDIFSNMRTFTALDEDGIVKEGSLRMARCVNQGLYLYGTIECLKEDEALVREVLSLIKWIGTMRNRGFGKVEVEEV